MPRDSHNTDPARRMGNQVKLPLSVAFAVVMQGIRIRLGRSLITIAGVGLGIAFLMANLTGQIVKRGVQEEDRIRTETRRMASFLAGEMGPPEGRVIGVIQTGPLDEVETSLVTQLAQGNPERLQWHRVDPSAELPENLSFEPVALDAVAREASCVLLIGSGNAPARVTSGEPLASLLSGAREKILAVTRAETHVTPADGVAVVKLARELFPEELAELEEQRQYARFRTIWVSVISLLVTVGGIANAMLMSVMERFREIGTMKCLGALSSFVRWVFLLEAGLMGAAGGIAGAVVGAAGSLVMYAFSYGFGVVFTSVDAWSVAQCLGLSVAAGIGLSILAALYPAGVAASMVPANALSTNV